MLLSPSLSPSPLDSPSTTTMSSPPLPPPSPPLLTPHLAPTSTPPIQQPPLLPVISPSPPAVVAISPVTTPPLPPVVTSPPPTPPATTTVGPIASPPPPALVIIPPPQPPTTLPSPPPSLILPPPLTTHPSLQPPPLTTSPSLPLPRLPIDPPPPPQPPLVIIPPPLPPATLPLPPPSLIFPPPLTTAPSLPPPPLTTAPSLPPPFSSISPPQPPASPAAPAASHSIKSPKTPGPFQAIPSPAQPPPPVSFQSFPPPAPPPPPPSLTLTGRKGGLPTTKQTPHSPIGLIVASIGVTILLFVVLALVCICCKRRRRKHKPLDTKKQQCSVQKVSIQHKQGNVVNAALGSGSINVATLIADNTTLNSSLDGIFTYEELVIATDGFSESNLLGQGGFGYVYKGRLPTGQDVAVKKLKAGSQQGEREFRAEVETISRVHHKHLVSLVGYCINGAERLLVYEFVTNKTLEFHLYENGQPVMVWESRLKIAVGSAKGLAYLHEDCSPTIIHRDIKAANILLDMRFEAKVSDFGLAKIFFDASSSITHISTRVMGTFGYLAPEYALTGKLTDKSDVYSYGVMLLELITGRPPIIEQDSSTNQSLVDWARPLLARALEDNDFDTLVDRRLDGRYNKSKMASMVSCAAACIRQSAWLRPRMIQVVRALEDDISLPYLDEGTRFSNSSSNASSDTFIRNAKRCINDVGFREHYETTSEYSI